MIDFKKLIKFKKQKDALTNFLEELQDGIENKADPITILAILIQYLNTVEDIMKLSAKDFTGDGAHDFRFGFIMPKKCLYEDDCMWICENMIRPWGISNRTIESD